MNLNHIQTNNIKQFNSVNFSRPASNVTRLSFCASKDSVDFSADTKAKEKKSLKQIILSILEAILSIFKKKENTEPAKPVNIVDASKRLKKASQVMHDFARILEEDQKRATPVLKNIKEGTLQKIFEIAYKQPDKPILLGITGGSGSGKTTIKDTFVKRVQELAPDTPGQKPFISDISQDMFYYDFSDLIKKKGADWVFQNVDFNDPKTVELSLLAKKLQELKQGKEVKIPEYLLNGTGIRTDDKIPVKPAKLIAVEGLFTLTNKKLRDMFDLKVFIDASEKVRTKRWWDRAESRNIKHDAAGNALFKMTMDDHNKFVEPGKKTADIVINSEADFRSTNKVMRQLAETLTKPVSFAGLFNKDKKAA